MQRLDQALSKMLPQYSRSRLQSWIKNGELTVNGASASQKTRVYGGEEISLDAEEAVLDAQPEDLPLDVIYEDDDVLVINKPAGVVVHPGAGNPAGTMMNALLHHYPASSAVPRAGIVHRLDKDTTGLMVVARHIESQNTLVQMIAGHEVERRYDAVAYGEPDHPEGTLDEPIGRHPVRRTLMAVVPGGKPAVTHYRVIQKYGFCSLIECSLETGRTHQIRVHLSRMGHPLIGDAAYGGQFRRPRGAGETLIETMKNFNRQALHARALSFEQPITGEWLSFEVDQPDDLAMLLRQIGEYAPDPQF